MCSEFRDQKMKEKHISWDVDLATRRYERALEDSRARLREHDMSYDKLGR